MKRMILVLFFVFVIVLHGETVGTVKSPNNNLKAEMILENGALLYQVKLGGEIAIEKSLLGLRLDDRNFIDKMTFSSQGKVKTIKDSYELLSGKKLTHETVSNQSDFVFENEDGKELVIRFRLFDDGVSFRYMINDKSKHDHEIRGEETSFNLPDLGKAWMSPYDKISPWTPAYETRYQNEIPIGTTAPAHQNGWEFPLLFNADDKWILITAGGDDYRDYTAVHLEPDCPDGEYRVCYAEADEAYNVYPQLPVVNCPWQSPWRIIIISEKLSEVVESNIVTHLSDENKLKDTDWIKPGRASWSWWSVSESPKNYQALKNFVDFSAEMDWEYSLVDANWQSMEGGNLEKLARYAATKNVGLLVWYNSGGDHNTVGEEPRDIMSNSVARKKEFKWLNKIGIKGIKVDFFQSDKQGIMRQYTDILKDAADYELVVNFHGCTLPRGWRRTYPNLLTMESVCGAECYKFAKEFPASAPVFNTVYPFTRNVVGPMDYTPVTFSHNVLPHHTTMGHELAQSVVFESGIIHMADHYEAYRAQPEFVLGFLKKVPAVWDDTKLLDGYPGREVIIARRSGDNWYIGGLNGEFKGKSFTVDLGFLGSGDYDATVIADGDKNDQFSKNREKVTRQDKISVDVLRYGGFVMELKVVRK
ncbi:MAG: glycoside hydrolase family 97 catalytic domain-containing protein [Fidelibacterota bacterium]